jgi:hypothetical protein
VRAESLKTKAKKLLDHLSEDKAKVAVSFLEFLEEKECWEATKEILKDRELMASIQRGKEDIVKGRVRPWREVKKNV